MPHTKAKTPKGKSNMQYKKFQRMHTQLSNMVSEGDVSNDDQRIKVHDSIIGGARAFKQRKQTRKNMRKLKKARRQAYHTGKQIPSLDDMRKPLKKKKKSKKKLKNDSPKKLDGQTTNIKSDTVDSDENIESDIETEVESRKDLELENAEDMKIIHILEKKMKLNKKKSLPKMFADEGLDYLLDTIGSYDKSQGETLIGDDFLQQTVTGNLKGSKQVDDDVDNYEDEDDDGDVESDEDLEEEDDFDALDEEFTDISSAEEDNLEYQVKMDTTQLAKQKLILKSSSLDKKSEKLSPRPEKLKVATEGRKSVTFASSDNDIIPLSNCKEPCKKSNVSENAVCNNTTTADTDSEVKTDIFTKETISSEKKLKRKVTSNQTVEVEQSEGVEQRGELHEDIYGRLRDADGMIVQEQNYVPPAKRLMMQYQGDAKAQVKLTQLTKLLRGLVNRTSESNMRSVCSQIEALYRQYSHADVNQTLTQLVLDACVTPSLSPDRLIIELSMLIAILHSNVGLEVGAYFLQTLVKHYNGISHSLLGKQSNNCLILLAHLYNFQIIHSCLIFDVLQKLIDTFSEKDIELILVLIKNVGFTLRKDDPNALKEMIISIQEKARCVDTSSFTDQSRVQFMLDILLAIRNNNMRKIPNYDTTHVDHLRKNLHSYITGSKGDSLLRIHYDDLLKAEEHGRWWIVGSAWSGPTRETSNNDPSLRQVADENTTRILALATKQRMNTDIRKNIFCLIMTSEDYVDAYEKLLRLGLQHKQEREIIYVIVDCCLQEKAFNQFYSYLLQKMTTHDRRFKMTLQFHIWDKIKCISDVNDTNRSNFSYLLASLIASKALTLSVLKVIEFGTLGKELAKILRIVLTSLLTEHPLTLVEEVFTRIAVQPKLRQLCDGLRLFMQHFFIKGKENEHLTEFINIACEILASHNKVHL